MRNTAILTLPDTSESAINELRHGMESRGREFMCDICGATSDSPRGWCLTPGVEICDKHD